MPVCACVWLCVSSCVCCYVCDLCVAVRVWLWCVHSAGSSVKPRKSYGGSSATPVARHERHAPLLPRPLLPSNVPSPLLVNSHRPRLRRLSMVTWATARRPVHRLLQWPPHRAHPQAWCRSHRMRRRNRRRRRRRQNQCRQHQRPHKGWHRVACLALRLVGTWHTTSASASPSTRTRCGWRTTSNTNTHRRHLRRLQSRCSTPSTRCGNARPVAALTYRKAFRTDKGRRGPGRAHVIRGSASATLRRTRSSTPT